MAILAGKRILVVEDDFMIADLLCDWLTRAGATLVSPTDQSALALGVVAAETLECAVLDVRLASGTCQNVAWALRVPSVPVLIVSGLPPADLPSDLRVAPYIQKPLRSKAFLELAAQIFG